MLEAIPGIIFPQVARTLTVNSTFLLSDFLKQMLVSNTYILLVFQWKMKYVVKMAGLMRFSGRKCSTWHWVGLNAGIPKIFDMCKSSRILCKLIFR